MSVQLPDNSNTVNGQSVFENVFIYGKLEYDFSETSVSFKDLNVPGWISVGSTATFSSDVTISSDLTVRNLTASGSITADSYENFVFADLPVGTAEETTFGPNKVLTVKHDSSGYELVDPSVLTVVQLRSTGVSGDEII